MYATPSKRDFGRAFDTPVGFQGDILAAEPQAVYDLPAHAIPGQWPGDESDIDDDTAPAASSTFFTTAARFATSVTVEICKLPYRLVQRFTRQQQIRVVPVFREDGASKRRLVDAGLAPSTPARRRDSPQQHSRSPDVTLPRLWMTTPPTPPPSPPQPLPIFTTPSYNYDHQDDDIDDSLDWSMDDVSSGTPSHNPQSGSPTSVSWLRRPDRRIISPRSQLRKSSIVPMREQLLKRQLRAAESTAASADRIADSARTPPKLPRPSEAIDPGLSHLPDAPLDSSSPTKAIRWAAHSSVKSYYIDEKVSDMLDSTLESIRSPTSKPIFDDEDSEDQLEVSTNPDSSSEFGDSDGEPSLEDPLEESQLSKELLQDLEEDFKNLLAQAPAPAPPKSLFTSLSDAERTNLEDVAAKSKHGRDEAFSIVPNKITARDFGTLLPAQFNGNAMAWLNDEIVNEYLRLLVKQSNDDALFTFKRGGPAPPYHAFSSHWYTSIKANVKKVERWASRACLGGKQFLDAELILYPICDSSHWRLLAIKPKERTIEYLDSLAFDGTKYIDKMHLYLKSELKDLYIEDEWKVVEHQRSSRQLNGSDCGVFVLLNALALLLGYDMKMVVASQGMLEARERVATTIITGHATELD